MVTTSTGEKVVDILMRSHPIDPDSLVDAQAEAQKSGLRLERVLVEKELVSGEAMALALAEYLSMPPLNLDGFTANSSLLELIPKETLMRHRMMPIAKVGKMLTLAMGDPFDLMAIEEIHGLTALEIVVVVVIHRRCVGSGEL